MPSARCTRCSAQLIPGNSFCPECGWGGRPSPCCRIELAARVAEDPERSQAVPAGTLLATEHGALAMPAVKPPALRIASSHRLSWVFFSFVALLAMIAGVLTWQIIRRGRDGQLGEHAAAQHLGRHARRVAHVEIDTGPAKTAVAVRDLGLTATPTNTPAPTSTATPEPDPDRVIYAATDRDGYRPRDSDRAGRGQFTGRGAIGHAAADLNHRRTPDRDDR